MSHVASSHQTSVGLCLTLNQLETDATLDALDPTFIALKCCLLVRLITIVVSADGHLGTIPVVSVATMCHGSSTMTIHIVLHVLDADLLLFAGTPDQCPPIPRAGDEIIHEQRRVRLEGIRYHYRADHLEIGLMA